MYGSKFADLWRGCDLQSVKAIWAEDLAGYTNDELRYGLESCKTRTFPPTLPEFMTLCRPPVDYEQCFIHAVEQMRKREGNRDVWSNPAVYWAAVRMGGDLFTQAYVVVKVRWRMALDEAIEKVRSGDLPNSVPIRRESLPPPGRTTSREVRMRNIEKLRSIINGCAVKISHPDGGA